jgi:glucose-6-phosphate 1-dehydrogenase
MKKDCIFVILGATGDLSRRKIIPAIYNLVKNKKIKRYAIVGVARDSSKVDKLLDNSRELIKNLDKKIWEELKKKYYYFQADFYDKDKFLDLGNFIRMIEKNNQLPGNRLFYLATLPQHFDVIASNLSSGKLTQEHKGKWSRVVFEKPFGEDLKTAKKLNKCLKKVFKEKQVYRIDHYLGKELVQNISVARFTNTILEPLWNKDHIDHVQIILNEKVGVGNRGEFYDKYGALKDVVQNHMMQILSLTAMEPPVKLVGEHIRNEKVKVLKSIKSIKKTDVVLGQYKGYKGYKGEKGVKKTSKTETFAALKLFIDNKRWKKVPFYLITGKKQKEKITSIYIQFKEAPCLLFQKVCNFLPNYLVIQIEPEEGFYIQLNAKVPGKTDITSIKMDFCHECTFGPNSPEAYENLLLDVIKGDQSVFVRSDEIEQQWKIVDSIIRKKPTVFSYKSKELPKGAQELIQKDRRQWHLKVK